MLRSWQLGATLIDLYKDTAKREHLSAEAQFEVEIFLKLSGADIAAAATFRSAWYQAVRRFFEEYDYFILPSAQVFPFDAKTRWPREIAGRKMDAYNRWMEVMVPGQCPAVRQSVCRRVSTRPVCRWDCRSWLQTMPSAAASSLHTHMIRSPAGSRGDRRRC